MNTRQYRIGNYIYIDNKIKKIRGVLEEGLLIDNTFYTGKSPSVIKPIPLIKLCKPSFKTGSIELLPAPDFTFRAYYNGQKLSSVRFVHEYQNIVFALTGEEPKLDFDNQ